VPALLLFGGFFFAPESPRHLVEKEKYEEAQRVLHKLLDDGTNEDWVRIQFAEIKATIDAENSITVPGWRIMFQVPQWRKRLMYVFQFAFPAVEIVQSLTMTGWELLCKSSRR
jgi:hypothetical protein